MLTSVTIDMQTQFWKDPSSVSYARMPLKILHQMQLSIRPKKDYTE